ncbi:MAG: hypothetical protein JSU63_17005 [Phycisphaerales bacterium]|nr:MAG: hypothetical protein JSU63_17005 [Phycisphaerales bacterium]
MTGRFFAVATAIAAGIVMLIGAPSALAQLSECETDILMADDGASNDRFGWTAAVSGDYAFFGATNAMSDASVATGAVYVYNRNELEWTQLQKLAPGPEEGTSGAQFGFAQAASGGLLLVGAKEANEGTIDTPGTPTTGAAYVFRVDAGSWVEEDKLVATDGETGDRFGGAVAIDGDAAVVGAPWRSTDQDHAGAVYFYRRDPAGWVQTAKRIAPTSQANSEFGDAVAISGNWAAVGAPLHDDPNFCGPIASCNSGAVWMYYNKDGVWTAGPKLLPDAAGELEQLDAFGSAVALDGDVLAVVADKGTGAVADTGAVYVYRRDDKGTPDNLGDDAWVEEAKLFASDGAKDDGFGRSLALKGSDIIVGAYTDEPAGAPASYNSGSAYLYRHDGQDWVEYALFDGSDDAQNDRYGQSVATDGDYLVVGAYRYSSNKGKGYTVRLSVGEDCDGNGYPDECDIISDPDNNDSNGNGVLDTCECTGDADCEDTLFCTTDTCNMDTARCERVVADGFCVLSSFCTPEDLTNPSNECQECNPSLDAWAWSPKSNGTVCTDDGNDCTDDICMEGSCTNPNKDSGMGCGDTTESECNHADTCDGLGTCLDNFEYEGVPCGSDNDTTCDGADACDGVGACDTNFAEQGTSCDDLEFCTGVDECDGGGICKSSGDPCGEGLMCTEAGGGACNCNPADDKCDDGEFCNGAETCSAVTNQCETSGYPCLDPGATVCDEDVNECVQCLVNEDCPACPDDTRDCDCTDAPVCTDKACTYANLLDNPCGDTGTNTDCDKPDTCDASGMCLDNYEDQGTSCGDTTDTICDQADTCDGAGTCETNITSAGTPCDDSLYCNGVDTCNGDGACISPGDPCGEGLICTEDGGGACKCNPADDRCDDGEYCNGAETCDEDSGLCTEPGDPCDGVECAGDFCGTNPIYCDEAGDRCVQCLTDQECSNDDWCDGPEQCVAYIAPPTGGDFRMICEVGIPPCPSLCDPDEERCVSCSDHAHCDNGQFCDGEEICVNGECQSGSDRCTGSTPHCDEGANNCFCQTDAECSDGAYCNGAETCSGGACLSGSDPCTDSEECDESGDECVECLEGDDCDDGDECTTDRCPYGECVNDPRPGCDDDDYDGVKNGSDSCPGTARGALVNSNGCSCSQLDSDDDGVDNCRDQCAGTPSDEQPNVAGCSCSQVDTDGDEVYNCSDACPETLSDQSVDDDGCAQSQLDDDGDGAFNNVDACSDTPDGETVNAFGCSDSQLDDDADGVSNDLDECPGTTAEERDEADEEGCSPSQREPTEPQPVDTDEDGVLDDVDECPNTPADEVDNVDATGCTIDDDTEPPPTGGTSPCGLFNLSIFAFICLGLGAMRWSVRRGRRGS